MKPILACLSLLVAVSGYLTSSVQIDPPVVGTSNSTFILQYLIDKPVKAGSKVTVQVPKQASVLGGSQLCSVKSSSAGDNLQCAADSSKSTLSITIPYNLTTMAPTEIRWKLCFNAPMSTAATDSFQFTIVDPTGNVTAQMTTGLSLLQLNPAKLASASVFVQAKVGGISTATFNITTNIAIPPGGGLQLALPKWNNLAPSALRQSFVVLPADYNAVVASQQQKRLLQTQPNLCDFTQTPSAFCQLQTSASQDLLTLIGAFPKGNPAGKPIIFNVNYMRSPISLSPITLQVQTFTSVQNQTTSSVAGLIEQGSTNLLATASASMDPNVTVITADDSSVQEYTTIYVPFSVPVPVQAGCRLVISLPDDFLFNPGDISLVQGWGIFGGKKILTAAVDTTARTIIINNQCSNYTSANLVSTVQISSLRNPTFVKPTKPLSITLQDSNSNLIASLNSAIYTPSPGAIVNVNMTSTRGIEIQTISDVVLSFTPNHKINGDTGYITMSLPSNVNFTCSLAFTTNLQTNPSCTQTAPNVLRFDSVFLNNNYAGNVPLSISFSNRVLPSSAQDIRGIKISTFVVNNGTSYLVDQIDDPTYLFFKMQSVQFFADSVRSNSGITYSSTGLTFLITVANRIPSNGIVQVIFPNDVIVPDLTSIPCIMPSNQSAILNCTFGRTLTSNVHSNPSLNSSFVVVTILNIFSARSLNANDQFDLQFSKGIITPISMKTTEPFVVQVLDSQGYEINYSSPGLTLTMQQGIDIGPLTLQAESYIVGASTNHALVFTSPIPLYNGTRVYLSIPQEITPQADAFIVSSIQPIAQSFQSFIIGNKVTIIVAVDPSTGSSIPSGTMISFKFGPVINPQSMAASSPYSVQIDSSEGYGEASQVTLGVKMRNQMPAAITDFNFTAGDLRPGALTTITISWKNTLSYPLNLALNITFDNSQIYPKIQGQSSSPCIFRGSRFVTCQFFDGYILVSQILQSPQTAGQLMSLTINNMLLNVHEAITTNSWTMTAFTGPYQIESIGSGMTFTFACQDPCLTCTDDPTQCTSCNDYDLSSYLILFDEKCYSTCPDGTYEESFQCKPCDPKCKSCDKTNPQQCTSCDPYSAHPFLEGTTCAKDCFFGEFGNLATAKCEPCQSPCQTCVGDASTCLSCDPTQPDVYFYQNQCLKGCPAFTVADTLTRSTHCEDCSKNCYDCFGTKDYCQSCTNGLLLNKVANANNCVQSCPPSISVVNKTDGSCQPCDDTCLTCSGIASNCTSCRQNLNLNQGQCTLQCDNQGFTRVALDGHCVACDPSCATCSGTTKNCLTCGYGTYWYNTTCVKECPTVDGYKYQPNSLDQCVIPGLKCKFGYKVSPSGNSCEFLLAVCPPPQAINYDRTRCMPGTEKIVPFPIWILWVAPTFLVILISKLKTKETMFIQSWLVFLSIAEIAAMIYTLYLASDFGIAPVTGLLGFSIAVHFGINFFFLLVFSKEVKLDNAFAHWCEYNPKVTKTITFIGTAFNFKAYRLFFSRLFGRDEFNASMENPMTFYAPFKLASVLNLIFVKLVVLVACLFGLYYIRWGYQLMVECLELLLIELLMLALSLVEYLQLKGVVFKQQHYFKIRKGFAETKVSALQDSDPEIIDPRSDIKRQKISRTQKPKALQTILQMEKILNDFDVKDLKRVYGQNECLNDEELRGMEIMKRQRRNCASFRGLPSTLPEAWMDGDLDDQNFISEPNSPRSKQLLHNSQFISRMLALRFSMQHWTQSDNVYHEAVKRKKQVHGYLQQSVKVQTNIMELLGIDDLFAHRDFRSEVSGMHTDYGYEDVAGPIIHRGPRSVGSSQDRWASSNVKVKRRKGVTLSKTRMKEIPKYQPDEIQGEFMKDEEGLCLVVRKDGKLTDHYGREVNRKGYLIDSLGNIVTRGGVIIFYATEVNREDEIPLPFCQSQEPLQLRAVDNEEYKPLQKRLKFDMQERYIEREYQRLKNESNLRNNWENGPRYGTMSNKSKSTSKPGTRSLGTKSVESKASRTISSQRTKTGKLSDNDSFADIVQPIKPKTKQQLMGGKSPKSRSRHQSVGSQSKSEVRKQSLNSRRSRGHSTKSAISKISKVGSVSSQPQETHLVTIDVRKPSTRNSMDLVDLKFEHEPVKTTQTKQAKRVTSAETTLKPKPNNIYSENQRQLEEKRQALRNEQDFLAKMTEFNRYIDKHQRNQPPELPIRLQNLGTVYGRVKQQFNRSIRQTGAQLKLGRMEKAYSDVEDFLQKRRNSDLKELRGQSDLPKEVTGEVERPVRGARQTDSRLSELQRIYIGKSKDEPTSRPNTHMPHRSDLFHGRYI